MAIYLPDTNVLIGFCHDQAIYAKLENARQSGIKFVIGPPVLIELVRGMISSSHDTFENDKRVFSWLEAQCPAILPLPRPFMAKILHTTTRTGPVRPEHYSELIQMVVSSADHRDFLRKSDTAGSVWKDIANLDRTHEAQLEKELSALEGMAGNRAENFVRGLSHTFGAPGCRPHPLILEKRFSAAIEFLQSSLSKIQRGAKPRKNDRGLYVDFQLLLYLAEPEISFLTNERFSGEIRRSPQRTRIVGLDSLR